MGIFSSELAQEHRTKKRINELKRELATLTGGKHLLDMGMQGNKMLQVVRSKSHDAFDSFTDQMQDMGKKAKQNPSMTVALVAGISALAAMLITATRHR